MDRWIASSIEEYLNCGLEKRQMLNDKRNDQRKECSYMDDCMISFAGHNLLESCYRTTCNSKSMFTDLCTSQHNQKILDAANSSISSTYTTITSTPLNNEEYDDDDSDDELQILDVFDSFIECDSSEDDEVEEVKKPQQITWNSERLHYYTNIRLADACKTLW